MEGISVVIGIFGFVFYAVSCSSSYSNGYTKAQTDFLESPSVFADYAVKRRDSTDGGSHPAPVHTDSAVSDIIGQAHFTR